MSRWWLCAIATRRAFRRDRRVMLLASALVAAAVADLVFAWTWLETTVVFGAWILLACVMGAALAAAAPVRATTSDALDAEGAGSGIAPILAGMHALLICTIGSVIGLAVGFAVRARLVPYVPPHFSNDTNAVIVASVASVLGAMVVATVLSVVIVGVRGQRVGWGPPQLRRVVWLTISIVALVLGVSGVAANADTFQDLELSLFFFAPFIAFGAAVLASAVLSAAVVALRGRGGAVWFVTRNLGSNRMRTVPVLALVTITVGTCATGAILTSSLHQRFEDARDSLILNPDQAWATDHGGLDIDFSKMCEGMPAEQRPVDLCPTTPRPPDQLSPAVLSDTSIAMQNPDAEWVLLVAVLIVTLPLILIAVGLDRAGRAPDDELLELQGAPPGIRRQAAVLTALLVTLAGSVTGVLVAVLGTAAGIVIYNLQVRTNQEVVFPPVPFAASVPVLLGFVVVVPAAAALSAAIVAPRRRLRPGLDLPQMVEQPVRFA